MATFKELADLEKIKCRCFHLETINTKLVDQRDGLLEVNRELKSEISNMKTDHKENKDRFTIMGGILVGGMLAGGFCCFFLVILDRLISQAEVPTPQPKPAITFSSQEVSTELQIKQKEVLIPPAPGTLLRRFPIYLLTVKRVVDGDTLHGTIHLPYGIDYTPKGIRALGYDAWESSKRRKGVTDEEVVKGKKATTYLQNLLKGRKVYIVLIEPEGSHGKYGRALGLLAIQREGKLEWVSTLMKANNHIRTLPPPEELPPPVGYKYKRVRTFVGEPSELVLVPIEPNPPLSALAPEPRKCELYFKLPELPPEPETPLGSIY